VALFGKKKGLVGLDIGSSAVKAVELKSGGKGGAEHQLVNIGMEALPPEAIVDGAIMDSGAVIDAIQRLFTAQKIKTADVALMGNDLRHLPGFLILSDRTLRIINQNLLCGFAFIALFVALSAFGIINPITAAALHEFSAFFVIFNSARLLRFDEQSAHS